MTIKRACLLTAALLTLAALVWLSQAPALGNQPGHTALHLNCPPGSHGQPRHTGVGQSLDKARQDARAARSLESRALTSQ